MLAFLDVSKLTLNNPLLSAVCVAGRAHLPTHTEMAATWILILLTPTMITAMKIQPVLHGLVTQEMGTLYPIQEEATVLIAMKTESQDLIQLMNQAITNYTTLLNQRERDPRVRNIVGRRLEVLGLDIRTMALPSPSRRMRRGWLNFVGEGAKKLFGVATESDMKGFRAAVLSNGKAIDKIARQGNHLVGVVNALSQEQKWTIDEMNRIIQVIEQQRSVVDKLATITKSIAVSVDGLATRLYLESLLSMLESHWSAIRAFNTRRHNHRVQCEQGQLTEDLLDPLFLTTIQGSVETKLTPEWYYNHVRIDSLLEIDGHFICKVILPILRNEPYVDVQIYSLPVPTPDGKFLQVYHSVEVAVRQDGDLLFPQQCVGEEPKVCHAGPRFDRRHSECIDGILSGHQEKQKACEVTYTTTFDQAKLARIGTNTFLAYLTSTTVEERCKEGLPETVSVTAPINIITIEPGCLMDAGNYQIEGTYQQTFNSSEEKEEDSLLAPVILPQWELAAGINVSDTFLRYPHLREIKIPSFHRIDDTLEIHAERDVINALKDSKYKWYEDWSVYVVGLLAIIALLGLTWVLHQHGLCPIKKTLPQDKENATPTYVPRSSAPLYPDLTQLQKEATAPIYTQTHSAVSEETAEQHCILTQNTQPTVHQIQACMASLREPTESLVPENRAPTAQD